MTTCCRRRRVERATITPEMLTASIIGDPTKPYGGNTTASLTSANFSLSGLIGTESFTVTQTSATYNSKDVLTASTVTASLSADDFTAANGTLASDYTLPTTASGAGTITPETLTASIIGDPTKPYDGNTTASLTSSNFSLSGLIGGRELHRDLADLGDVQQQGRADREHGDGQPFSGRLHRR